MTQRDESNSRLVAALGRSASSGVAVPSRVDVTPAHIRLTRHRWKQVQKGADGLGAWRHGPRRLRMIHSMAIERDGNLWEHVSISRDDGQMPTWEQARDVFREVCGSDALGIVVIPPESEHVNIAEVAHVWRCLTARPLPDFTHGSGSI